MNVISGMQNQFSPEQLGVISSSALAYSIFELIIYSITLYISNISTTMKTLDLLAFSGYKFVTINLCILVSIIFKRFGYYLALIYTSITLCFFLVRIHHELLKQIYFNFNAKHIFYFSYVHWKRKFFAKVHQVQPLMMHMVMFNNLKFMLIIQPVESENYIFCFWFRLLSRFYHFSCPCI